MNDRDSKPTRFFEVGSFLIERSVKKYAAIFTSDKKTLSQIVIASGYATACGDRLTSAHVITRVIQSKSRLVGRGAG